MRILYGAPASVFVRKPRILLQEKGINFVTQATNPMVELTQEFKVISPLKKIPVFKDGDYVLNDSSAICAYIDMAYPTPSFYPKEPKALGKVLWLEEYADTALFQAIAPVYYQTVLVPLYRNRQPDIQAIHNAISLQLPPIADYLEALLVDRNYFVEEKFTIADIAVSSMFFNMYLSGYPLAKGKWPNLSAYLASIFQRESFKDCMRDVMLEVERAKTVDVKACK